MKRTYIGLVLCALLILSADKVFPLNTVRTVSQNIISPVSFIFYNIGQTGEEAIQFVWRMPSVYQENKQLRKEIIELHEKTIALEQLQQQNESLREQLNVQGVRERKKVVANVVGTQQEGTSIVLVLDKGSNDGVKKDEVVITGQQLVGKIERVGETHAYVLPIVAVDSRVPARVTSEDKGDSVKGLVKGRFNTQIVLTEVLQENNLEVGDIIVSSGEGGVYPAQLLIGEIRSINVKDNELFKTAEINALWDVDTLGTVFVLTGGDE